MTTRVCLKSEIFQSYFCIFYLACCVQPVILRSCPSQCSCFNHNLSNGTKARSVICNDPEISQVPANFPVDTYKLRIEKTAIKRIPSEAFHNFANLEFLWMSFNSVTSLNLDSFRGLRGLDELRLDGNAITSFPWKSLVDMPNLMLLDLHNNKITAIDNEAGFYIKNLTYLDLSSNNLITLPSEVFSTWLTQKHCQGVNHSKIILGLHDNPWVCDCRLYDLVKFQKSPPSLVAFIDVRLTCSEPESLSGVQFNNADLHRCQRPQVRSAVGRIRSVASNVILLSCGATGVPTPEISWSRADGKQISGTAEHDVSKEGIIWSTLRVCAVSYEDSGKYICKATNFIGTAEDAILLVITDTPKSQSQNSSSKKQITTKPFLLDLYKQTAPTSSSRPVTEPLQYSGLYLGTENHAVRKTLKDMKTLSPAISVETPKNPLNGEAANSSFSQQGLERLVRSVKVVQDADHMVSLNWRAPGVENTTVFTVLYAIFGQRDMRKINVSPGKNRITIKGLKPKTKYIACVSVKGLIPNKGQCVIFSTNEATGANGAKLINVVVITTGCIITVPLTLIVCYGGLKKCCKKLLKRKSERAEDEYITFHALPPVCKAKGLENQYITTLSLADSKQLTSPKEGCISNH